jgi:hypothetical protein
MTPKEKAEELIARFRIISYHLDDIANHKECARVAVDEILNIDNIKPYVLHKEIIEFYQEVKQEINLL